VLRLFFCFGLPRCLGAAPCFSDFAVHGCGNGNSVSWPERTLQWAKRTATSPRCSPPCGCPSPRYRQTSTQQLLCTHWWPLLHTQEHKQARRRGPNRLPRADGPYSSLSPSSSSSFSMTHCEARCASRRRSISAVRANARRRRSACARSNSSRSAARAARYAGDCSSS